MLRASLLLVAVTSLCAQHRRDIEESRRLVRLNVAATDTRGKPVIDLRVTDIQVREDGKVRPVVFFRFAGSNRANLPMASGEIANRPAPAPTVILFDRWDERAVTAASARVEVSAALQHMESVERVFIYFLTSRGDLLPVHPLPQADADLRKNPVPTPEQLRAELDQAVRKLNGLRGIDGLDPVSRANVTLQALAVLGREIASISGRKNLIWATHGFPLTVPWVGGDYVDFTAEVQNLSDAAARDQIAIYAVAESGEGVGADVEGLSRETLEMFASLTGGRFYSSDQTGSALADALADSRGTYSIAYYSQNRVNDKKEHKIKLESSRKTVRLLTRGSFLSGTVVPNQDVAEQTLLSNECDSPFDATEIGLRVALSRGADNSMHFTVRIDPADVLLEQQGGVYKSELVLMFATYSRGVLKRDPSVFPISVNLTDDQLSRAKQEGIEVSRDTLVNSDIEKIRVIVLDRKLGAIGSVTVSSVK
jgi:VWFA-related protein